MSVKLIVLVVLLALTMCRAQRLGINVYYESLCPDSAKFIVEQLQPLKAGSLGRYLDLTLVPFGKANYTTVGSDVQFTCQHGPKECYGNKVHSCAIQHIQVDSYQNTQTRESLSLDYVTCLMKLAINFQDATYPGEKCARDLQLRNWNVIDTCANSTEGSKLLQHNGELTSQLKPPLTSVPTITFNQLYDHDNQELALRDLRAAVCRNLRSPQPQECAYSTGSTVNSATVLATIIISLTSFVLAKLA